MIKEWCKKVCADCAHPCSLDERIPCSPDCEFLSLDGSRCENPEGACDFFAEVSKWDFI